MCLGIPGKVLSIVERELTMARVAFGGVVKEVCLAYVPEAAVGDYVIVHAGFAISRVDEQEAARVFSYLEEIGAASEGPADAEGPPR
ncbi:MAG: HypC/HybG/HupF family hydrogenase formation chaperone [Polyangiaceae bacterium]|nr:HypC/HybG/HupF family hydrogenase formation chaperone [Polyangiaceae bacterium]